MSHAHWTKCQYGEIHSRCRCMEGAKNIRLIDCDTPAEHAPATPQLVTFDPKDPAIVERAARALRVAAGGVDGHWNDLTDGTREMYRKDARAVLAALAGDQR